MGRGVSVPVNAEAVFYTYVDNPGDQFEYDDLAENIKYTLMNKFKSLYESDRWLGRENKVLLENDLVCIGVSEYTGCVSIWVVPKEQFKNLAWNFMETIKPVLKQFARIRKVGVMSNGVPVYKRL